MNNLHKLIDASRRARIGKDITWSIGLTASDAQELWKVFRKKAGAAVCFDMGDLVELARMPQAAELCRLPYETCWFEGVVSIPGSRDVTWGALIFERGGDRNELPIMIFACRPDDGSWILVDAVGVNSLVDEYYRCASTLPSEDITSKNVSSVIRSIAGFLTAMNCANIEALRHDPPKFSQRQRVKKGKQPLFSYWTLHLKTKSASGVEMGGTHASPRVHLRRGHPRQYQPGKWTWVQPCMVGNPKMGMVHKDYDGSALAH